MSPIEKVSILLALPSFLLLSYDDGAARLGRRVWMSVKSVTGDFALAISRDPSDCRMYLWTRRNRRRPFHLRSASMSALNDSPFNAWDPCNWP